MSDTVGGPAPKRRFDIVAVLRRTFAMVGRNFLLFAFLSLLLVGVPQGLLLWAILRFAEAGDSLAQLRLAAPAWAVLTIAGVLMYAALVHAAMAGMNGRKATLGESLRAAAGHFIPLLAMQLVMIVPILIGFLLLIVPGVMLAIAWSMALPARVVERTGVLRSLGRSLELTRGSRWAVFGVFVVVLVLGAIIGAVVGGLMGFVIGLAAPSQVDLLVSVLVQPVTTAVGSMIYAAAMAAIYYELRANKEGIAPGTLASVFD